MSMSSHVKGIVPADDKFQMMYKIWKTCYEGEVSIPEEVREFFGLEFEGEEPDPTGLEIAIEHTEAVKDWTAEMSTGFEVDLTKLPKNVKIIRFYNSW